MFSVNLEFSILRFGVCEDSPDEEIAHFGKFSNVDEFIVPPEFPIAWNAGSVFVEFEWLLFDENEELETEKFAFLN